MGRQWRHPVDVGPEDHLREAAERPLLHDERRVGQEITERHARLMDRVETRRHPLRQATHGCRVRCWSSRSHRQGLCRTQYPVLAESHRPAEKEQNTIGALRSVNAKNQRFQRVSHRNRRVLPDRQQKGIEGRDTQRGRVRPTGIYRCQVREHVFGVDQHRRREPL